MDEKMLKRKANRFKLGKKFEGPISPLDEKLEEGFGELSLKEYSNMQKKHLQAYLKGYPYFTYKGRRYKVKYTYGN